MKYFIHFGAVLYAEETHCKGTETEDIPPFVSAISPIVTLAATTTLTTLNYASIEL